MCVIAKKYQYDEDFKKAPVPKKDEKPIMGLVSDKNFIVANAVENILAGKYTTRLAHILFINQIAYLLFYNST
jgi:hypothetical protein